MNYNYIVESLVNPSIVSWISVREDNSIPETIQNSITHIFSQNQHGKTVIPLLNMPAPTIQARESVAVRISTSGYSFLNYTLTKPTLLVGTPNRFLFSEALCTLVQLVRIEQDLFCLLLTTTIRIIASLQDLVILLGTPLTFLICPTRSTSRKPGQNGPATAPQIRRTDRPRNGNWHPQSDSCPRASSPDRCC